MIIFILLLLSIVLLYSLLLVSVETKTYEMGIMRMLGMNKIGIILMILVQAFSFVVPGIILGLIGSIPFLMIARSEIKNAIGAEISINPTANAVIYAISIGIVIPLVSSYYPIKEALKQTLGEALDVAHSKTLSVKIKIAHEGNEFP